MITEDLYTYVFSKKLKSKPPIIDIKSNEQVEGHIQYPYPVTGPQPAITRVLQPVTGINRWDSIYTIGYTGILRITLSDNRVEFDLSTHGITGIAEDQYYALTIKAHSLYGDKSKASIIMHVNNEVGDYI